MVNRDFRGIICPPRLSHLLESDRFLYGYYNSEQHLIQVKICTAVDKEKEPQKNYSYVRSWKQEEVDPKRIS